MESEGGILDKKSAAICANIIVVIGIIDGLGRSIIKWRYIWSSSNHTGYMNNNRLFIWKFRVINSDIEIHMD